MTDVSRETPPAPPEAQGVFGAERLPLAERYAAVLATAGVVRGLIGPREAPRLWERHLLNSAVLEEAIPQGASVCDIGSGAGLPGVALAIARPDVQVTLVEPLLRRTTFLDEVVAELGLDRVEVVRGRADALHGARRFDVVTSRAVAPLDRLLRWSMPLVAPEGALVAMKGSSVSAEVAEATEVLRELGCAPPVVLELGADRVGAGGATGAVRVVWSDPATVSWPLARAETPPGARSNHGGKRAGRRRRG